MEDITFYTRAIQDELSKKKIALPIPNNVAVTLNNLLGSENTSYGDIAKLAEREPSLTVKLLNLANSSFYAGLVRAKSIEQAIARIGVVGVRNLLMTIIFKEVFVCKSKYLSDEFTRNWQHSLACAVCAKKIAEKTNSPFLVQDAYLLGLLHDIGVVAVLDVLCTLYKNRDDMKLDTPALIDILYETHASAGAMVLRSLNFNEKLCRMVELHHAPDTYAPQDETLFNIVVLADALLRKAGISLKPDTAVAVIDLPAVSRLNVDGGFITALEDEIHTISSDMDKLL